MFKRVSIRYEYSFNTIEKARNHVENALKASTTPYLKIISNKRPNGF